MDPASVLVVVAMFLLAAAFISRPLAREEGRPIEEGERRLSALYAEQDQILALLYELDTDFAMGKILPEDYQRQRAERLTRGADVLKEIDQLAARPPASGDGREADLEARLEKEVARIRQTLGPSAGYCGECGSPLAGSDKYCPRCGTPVPLAGSTA
jgi:hypothetical protein